MADQGVWFKLHVAALDDNDLDNLSIADFGRWAKVGAYIKRHGNGGKITLTEPSKTLCAMLQIESFQALVSCLKMFPNYVVEEMQNSTVSPETNVNVTCVNWAKYQGDFSTARVRKYRQMKRSKRRGEEKRREETRGEEKIPPLRAAYNLPDWIPKKEWEEFAVSRKRKRAAMTPGIAARIVSVLERLRSAGHDPSEVLNKAVDRNWTSIEFDWIHKRDNMTELYAMPSRTTEEILADLRAKKKAGLR